MPIHENGEQWTYYQTAKIIAKTCHCDVICCYAEGDIINEYLNLHNPYWDFAYIQQHWYWIDDCGAKYTGDLPPNYPIKIIRSIHQEMEYFLKTQNYYHISK